MASWPERDFLNAKLQLARALEQLTNEKEQLAKERAQLVREQEQLTNEKEQLAKERAQLENTITQLRLANAKLTSECSNPSKATVAATDGMLCSCATHIWAVFQAHRCPQLPMAQNCRLFEWCAEQLLTTYGTATYLRMWECLRQVLVLIANALA